jgi:hypothetical protein
MEASRPTVPGEGSEALTNPDSGGKLSKKGKRKSDISPSLLGRAVRRMTGDIPQGIGAFVYLCSLQLYPLFWVSILSFNFV